MSDFEVMPIGTKARLEALETYAREVSSLVMGLVGNKPEFMTIVAGEQLADPLFCAARIEGRIHGARRRYRGPGRE